MDDLPYELFLKLAIKQPPKTINSLCRTNKLYLEYCNNQSFIRDLIYYSFDLLVDNPTFDDYATLITLYNQDYDRLINRYYNLMLNRLYTMFEQLESNSRDSPVYYLYEKLPSVGIRLNKGKTHGFALIKNPIFVEDIVKPAITDISLREIHNKINDIRSRTKGNLSSFELPEYLQEYDNDYYSWESRLENLIDFEDLYYYINMNDDKIIRRYTTIEID